MVKTADVSSVAVIVTAKIPFEIFLDDVINR
jgi:hypothetical protein